MRHAAAGLLSVVALAGCGGSGLEAEWPGPPRPSADGTVAVGPFNDYLAKYEDYASSPEALATEFLRLDDQSSGSTMMLVTAAGEQRERVTVSVELDGLADDSVHSVMYSLAMSKQGSDWRLSSACGSSAANPAAGTRSSQPPPASEICAANGPLPVITAAPARAASASASSRSSPRASAKQSAAANESPAP